MNPLSTTTALQLRLDNKEYRDLTGLVRRDEGQFPTHTGGFSDVYTGVFEGKRVAIKVLRIDGRSTDVVTIKRHLGREAAVWNRLNHPNVLRFLGLADDLGRDASCPALIAPYCPRGTSGEFFNFSNPPIQTRLRFILGVARGLDYLHGQDVVHGDLTPTNVLIGNNEEPLLCDFGRSRILNLRGFTSTKPAGTIRYQARELHIDTDVPNKKTDICAFGLTVFEFWTSTMPYAWIGNDNRVLPYLIQNGPPQPKPDPSPAMAETLWPILAPCLGHEPKDRPDIKTVLWRLESTIM